MRPTVFLLALLSTLPSIVVAQPRAIEGAGEKPRPATTHVDLWSETNPGVRYMLRRTSAPAMAHVIELDLEVEGISMDVTRYKARWKSVPEYARKEKVQGAINGGFWDKTGHAQGLAVSGGEVWKGSFDDGFFGFFAVTKEGRALISPPDAIVGNIDSYQMAVSGRPTLVRAGQLDTPQIDMAVAANARQPRTAVGVSRDGKKVWLVVVDGRQMLSKGMTMYELGRLLIDLGAHRALNLDGGGSSTMFLKSRGGVVSSPSGGTWEAALGLGVKTRKVRTKNGVEQYFVRGVSRQVLNHIVFEADEWDTQPLSASNELAPPKLIVLEPGSAISVDRYRSAAIKVAMMFLALMLIGFALRMRRVL